MSAVAARGTVEMLSAPERVKVSTDVPSQPLSSIVHQHPVRPDDGREAMISAYSGRFSR